MKIMFVFVKCILPTPKKNYKKQNTLQYYSTSKYKSPFDFKIFYPNTSALYPDWRLRPPLPSSTALTSTAISSVKHW